MSYVYFTTENLQRNRDPSKNFYIKSHPVFLFASPSSVAGETSVLKVSPSRRRRSGSSSMINGFANPMTILKQIFKNLLCFLILTHKHSEYESEHRSKWALLRPFFHYCLRSIYYCDVLLVKLFVFCCVGNQISVILSIVKGKIHWGLLKALQKKQSSTIPTSRPPLL